MRDFLVGNVRAFIEAEHVSPDLGLGLGATEVGEPALRELLFDAEGQVQLLPVLDEFEASAAGAVPGLGTALDLETHFDGFPRASGKGGEREGLAFFAGGKTLAELHAPVFNRRKLQLRAVPAFGGVGIVHRELALGLPGLVQPPSFLAEFEAGIGEKILWRLRRVESRRFERVKGP